MELFNDLLTNPLLYILLAAVLFWFSAGKQYLNVGKVCKEYFEEFIIKNRSLIIAIIVVPALLSFAITLRFTVNNEMIESIGVIISILMSLFFTFLSVFNETETKNDTDQNIDYNKKMYRNMLIQETKIVISYEILVGILLLVLCFIYPIFSCIILKKILSWFLCFAFFRLIFNFLIILKRFNNNT